jgi:hypothetical protein
MSSDDDPFASPGESSSEDGQGDESEEEEEEEEETGSQVTFDTSMSEADFLIPGGLNAFTVALPAKSERLFLKDLPKPIKPSGISKKNFVTAINTLNSSVRSLIKTAITENSIARNIHDSANNALRRGTKSLDAAGKEILSLKTELSSKNKKLMDVSEKMRQAVFERDASIQREETGVNNPKNNTEGTR